MGTHGAGMDEMDELIYLCEQVVAACDHCEDMDVLALSDEARWHKLFCQEAIEMWDGTGELVSFIKIHQNQRWYDIMRSN